MSALAKRTRMSPPCGIASAAFISRFWNICPSWPASASTPRRFLATVNVMPQRAPLRQNAAVCSASCTIDTAFFTGLPPLANVISCCVSSRARRAEPSARSSDDRVRSVRVGSVSARDTEPRMPVSKLLKSWAIPPASTPTASSFSTRWISISMFFCWVTSCTMTTRLCGTSSCTSQELLTLAHTGSKSARAKRHCAPTSGGELPSAGSASCRAASAASPGCTKSSSGRPTVSCSARSRNAQNAALARTIRPCGVASAMPTALVSNSARKRSSLARKALSALRRWLSSSARPETQTTCRSAPNVGTSENSTSIGVPSLRVRCASKRMKPSRFKSGWP